MPAPDNHSNHAESVEAEVRGNILAQPLIEGRAVTAASLDLPAPLVARMADRIIRSTFEERHRAVYEDRPGKRQDAAPAPLVFDREHWPPLRAFRASIAPDEDAWPERFPTDADPPELPRAAEYVATRLAGDGLPHALARVCDILSPLLRAAPGRAPELLRRAGFPVDLLDFFTIESRPLLERVLSRLASGAPRHSLDAEAAGARFEFRPTRPGFRAVDESGAQPADLLRMQVTRPAHWDGEGGGANSGDNLDLLIHLLRALPQTRFLLSVAANHADSLSASLVAAGIDTSRLTVVPAELPVSQWAQDNLKPGLLDSPPRHAALLPRYASRGEDGAKLDPGDTAVLSHLAAAGITSIHSPLHFQGGNVMLVTRSGGERLLLVGEAEIARNSTLGLTPDQAADALRIEMGAESVLVLPAVGFHLDTELSVRAVGGERLVFVPDEIAASRLILVSAIRALELAGIASRADAKVLRTFLEARNDHQLLSRLTGLLAGFIHPAGTFPASFAELFRPSPAESGPANLCRVLLAVDLLAAGLPIAPAPAMDAHALAYARAIRRSRADRVVMNQSLAAAGFRVVPVPSISAGNRSSSVINAIHLPDRVLLPVRGGFLKPIDDAAIKVMRSHLPPEIEITPIPAAESERRGGALHCSVAAFPDPNE